MAQTGEPPPDIAAYMKLPERCKSVRLILSDVDGVLTDRGIVLDNQGIEIKRFDIRDGVGVKLWQRSGGIFGIITARSSHIVELRAAELAIETVRQGVEAKLAAAQAILADAQLAIEQTCYIGDDLPDLALVRAAGLGVAVADACSELRDAADYVTDAAGGHGAVRETIEMILKSQGRWDDLIEKFTV